MLKHRTDLFDFDLFTVICSLTVESVLKSISLHPMPLGYVWNPVKDD